MLKLFAILLIAVGVGHLVIDFYFAGTDSGYDSTTSIILVLAILEIDRRLGLLQAKVNE